MALALCHNISSFLPSSFFNVLVVILLLWSFYMFLS